MIRRLALLLCLAAPAGAASVAHAAEDVVPGLSQTRVAITTTFEGSEILIFGAVRREQAVPDGRLEVIVTLAGPSTPVVVRRKERRFGIWINVDSVEVDRAPSFYAVATSAPFEDSISHTEDLRHGVSVRRAIRSVGAAPGIVDASLFTDALIRVREADRSYRTNPGTVRVREATLFNTTIRLPANLTEGNYTVRYLLTRGGRVIDTEQEIIYVRKAGLERFLAVLSREQPLVYGILSLVIAITAGWSASALFRWLRG